MIILLVIFGREIRIRKKMSSLFLGNRKARQAGWPSLAQTTPIYA